MVTARSGLFASIPGKDYLLFWQAGRFQPQRVARFLGLSNSEAASLSGVAPSSVRFDRKIPHGLRDLLSEVAATCTLVAEVFGGDATRTALWFKTRNPTLGDVSPRHMIVSGRHDQLRRFVMEAVGADAAAGAIADAPDPAPVKSQMPEDN